MKWQRRIWSSGLSPTVDRVLKIQKWVNSTPLNTYLYRKPTTNRTKIYNHISCSTRGETTTCIYQPDTSFRCHAVKACSWLLWQILAPTKNAWSSTSRRHPSAFSFRSVIRPSRRMSLPHSANSFLKFFFEISHAPSHSSETRFPVVLASK